ncbi:hypothetical protein L1987_81191 [Smallanthus sonchifolius]|uniref:Uncharacterized protein n=1 Tax=Smallanthus sonchifolius TaxID=185202 RepID=A0ACB8YP23_9ASTR|nr:hypothetical protein L1987_81191 [Smallanthus sonchifolius]
MRRKRHLILRSVVLVMEVCYGTKMERSVLEASGVYVVYETCDYARSSALALGIVSAVFTITTRIYISVSFGGDGCCRTDPNSTPVSKLLFVFSWVASVAAVVLLLAAAGLNNRQGEPVNSYYVTCYVVKPGIFAAGAILALLSTFSGIASYLTTSPTAMKPSIAVPVGANVDSEKMIMCLFFFSNALLNNTLDNNIKQKHNGL